jgi:hypothetical protein
VIVLSALPHASLQLRVTDDGKAQQLDLRTGVAGGDGYWQRQSAVDWKGEAPVVMPNTSGIRGMGALGAFTLSVTNPGAAIVATTPPRAASQPRQGEYAIVNNYQGGWAPQGQAFLIVPVPSLSGASMLAIGMGEPSHVRFDDAAAFSFTPTRGRTVRADPATETLSLQGFPRPQRRIDRCLPRPGQHHRRHAHFRPAQVAAGRRPWQDLLLGQAATAIHPETGLHPLARSTGAAARIRAASSTQRERAPRARQKELPRWHSMNPPPS